MMLAHTQTPVSVSSGMIWDAANYALAAVSQVDPGKHCEAEIVHAVNEHNEMHEQIKALVAALEAQDALEAHAVSCPDCREIECQEGFRLWSDATNKRAAAMRLVEGS